MYREADVSAIEAAWTARDRKVLADLGARLGIALAPEPLAALVKRAETGATVNARVRRRDVIATLLEAATYDAGIAVFTWDRWLCFAVRTDDRIVAAVAPGQSPSKIWAELKPWLGRLASNRARAAQWAATEAADRVVFARIDVAQPAPLVDDTDLIRQIIEDPDDPAPREVLTDLWLSRDDVRGKLAKLDAELAVLAPGSEDRRKREAVRAIVIKQHGARIAGEAAEHASAYSLRAGFVEHVSMTGAAFRDHGERLFGLQPIRRLLLLPSSTTTLATLAKGPVELLRELELHASAISIEPLRTAQLDRLEVLSFNGGARIDNERAFAELHAPRLRAIRCITHMHATSVRGLVRNRMICDRLEELVIAPALHATERLPGEAEIAREVFDEPFRFPRLRRVQARCWYITEDWVARLRERAPLLAEVELT